jgi:hypothetical protein
MAFKIHIQTIKTVFVDNGFHGAYEGCAGRSRWQLHLAVGTTNTDDDFFACRLFGFDGCLE